MDHARPARARTGESNVTDRLDRWADPPLLVLASLAAEPKHGYAITQDVAETMGVRLSAGTLYAVIARLEAQRPDRAARIGRPPSAVPHHDGQRQGAGAAVRADEQGRFGGQGAAEHQSRLGRSMRPPTSPGATPPGSTPARFDAAVAGRARPLPAVLAGPLRQRGPGAPRRLRRRPGRRGQRRLACGPGLDLPAEAPARPPRPDAVQPGHGARGLVHADRSRAGLRPAHPAPGLHRAGSSGGPLGLRGLRRQPGPLGAGRRGRRAAAVAADAAPGLARTSPAGHGVPAAAVDRARRVPGRPDRDDQAARPRERGRPLVVLGRRPGRVRRGRRRGGRTRPGPAQAAATGASPARWPRPRPAWPPRSWRWRPRPSWSPSSACACGNITSPATTTAPSPAVYLALVVAATTVTTVSAARGTRAALAEP